MRAGGAAVSAWQAVSSCEFGVCLWSCGQHYRNQSAVMSPCALELTQIINDRSVTLAPSAPSRLEVEEIGFHISPSSEAAEHSSFVDHDMKSLRRRVGDDDAPRVREATPRPASGFGSPPTCPAGLRCGRMAMRMAEEWRREAG